MQINKALVRSALMGILLVGMLAVAAQTDAQEKKKQGKSPSGDGALVFAQFMARFDKFDVNKDSYLAKEELIRAYGMAKLRGVLKMLDTDEDTRISREEFESWAQQEAPEYARRQAEIQKAQEEAAKKAKAAYDKAKKAYQQRLQQARRNAQNRNRNRNRYRNRRRRR